MSADSTVWRLLQVSAWQSAGAWTLCSWYTEELTEAQSNLHLHDSGSDSFSPVTWSFNEGGKKSLQWHWSPHGGAVDHVGVRQGAAGAWTPVHVQISLCPTLLLCNDDAKDLRHPLLIKFKSPTHYSDGFQLENLFKSGVMMTMNCISKTLSCKTDSCRKSRLNWAVLVQCSLFSQICSPQVIDRWFYIDFCIVVSFQRQTSLTGENCLLCGHLQVQEKGKSWAKMWVAVSKAEPLVLYLQSSGQVRVKHTHNNEPLH